VNDFNNLGVGREGYLKIRLEKEVFPYSWMGVPHIEEDRVENGSVRDCI